MLQVRNEWRGSSVRCHESGRYSRGSAALAGLAAVDAAKARLTRGFALKQEWPFRTAADTSPSLRAELENLEYEAAECDVLLKHRTLKSAAVHLVSQREHIPSPTVRAAASQVKRRPIPAR